MRRTAALMLAPAALALGSAAPFGGQARLALASMAAMCGAPASVPQGPIEYVLIPGLTPAHMPVSANKEAQAWFDQGLGQLWGFDYDEAHRSFEHAAKLDPACVMCGWGVAMALGPYINSGPIPAPQVERARAALAPALAKLDTLGPRDRALVEALAARYRPGGTESGVHGHAFARALTDLAARMPDDDLVAILAAEAIMTAQPWDYWEADGKTTRGRAGEAIALVERVLARSPDHPQAIHLYIHLTEASADPKRAEAGADKLARLAPAAPHMVHMPAHTFYRIGRFQDSLATNRAAIAADEAYAKAVGDPAKYPGYFRHHTHFIMSSAAQIGDKATALAAADALEAANAGAEPGSRRFDQLHAAVLHTRALFLAPDELLALPRPAVPSILPLWHGVRAEALAKLGRVGDARRELAAQRKAEKAGGGDMAALYGIARAIAEGRVAEARGRPDEALARYAAAERTEAALGYWEPPLWPIPVAVTVAEAKLRAGDKAGAAEAYGRALRKQPGNAWAERGLAAARGA